MRIAVYGAGGVAATLVDVWPMLGKMWFLLLVVLTWRRCGRRA